MNKVKVFGIEIDLYQKCKWCKNNTSKFYRVAYIQPCNKCRTTKKYQDYIHKKNKEDKKYMGMDETLSNSKPAAIWEGRGRQIITNKKGDIIANVPYKPRPVGRRDWKI